MLLKLKVFPFVKESVELMQEMFSPCCPATNILEVTNRFVSASHNYKGVEKSTRTTIITIKHSVSPSFRHDKNVRQELPSSE